MNVSAAERDVYNPVKVGFFFPAGYQKKKSAFCVAAERSLIQT